DLRLQRARGHDDQVDVGTGQAARGQGLAAGLHGEVDLRLARPGDAALLDADAGADPLVGRVDSLGQSIVRHDLGRLVAAEREHPRARSALTDPHLSTSRAVSRLSGFFRATVFTPGMPRRARPVNVPPGSSSITVVTPRSAIAVMQ